ncbi:MAG: restriction endonuclease subunit S [Candidatus Nitrosopumilus sp. bin_68KS]
MKFQKYENTKPSDIPWIGDIPEEWDVKPLFAYCKENHEKNTDGKVDHVLSLSYGNIIRRNVEDNFGLIPESFNSYQILKPGIIVLRLTDLQNDKKSLRVGLAKEKGIITSAYVGLIPNSKFNPEYLYYLLHSYDIRKVFYGMGGGVRQSMKFSDLKRIPLLLPSILEQKNIVFFIHERNQQIEKLIDFYNFILSKLKEKKITMINNFITQSLHMNPNFSNSSNNWIGKLPKDWKLERLKYHTIINQKDLSDKTDPDLEINYIEIGDVRIGEFIKSPTKMLYGVSPSRAKRIVSNNDVIFSTVRTNLKAIGFIENNMDNYICSTGFAVITPQSTLIPKFLFYFLLTDGYVHTVMANSVGVSYPAINSSKLGAFFSIIPPIEYQKSISELLDKKIDKIQLLSNKISLQIETLKKFKNDMIMTYVFGHSKIMPKN